MHLLCSLRAFISFLFEVCFQNKNTQFGCLGIIKSCFAVNVLPEFLIYRFYTADEKEAVAQQFSKEKRSEKCHIRQSTFLDRKFQFVDFQLL